MKKRLITFIFLGAVSIIIYVNFDFTAIAYYYIFKYPHFTSGDKIYIRKNDPNDGTLITSESAFDLGRLVKHLTPGEIDTMQIDKHQKAVLKLKADSVAFLKPYIIYSHDSVSKYNLSGTLGTYIDCAVLHIKSLDGKDIRQIFYMIKPDDQALNLNQPKIPLPGGFIYANNVYYISPIILSNTPI